MTGPDHRVTRRAGFGLAAAALTAGLMPAARAENGDGGGYDATSEYAWSHYVEDSKDVGGHAASVSYTYTDGSVQSAEFLPYGDRLRVRNGKA